MGKQRTHQEWKILIEQSESSSLSTRAFCKLNGLNPSTFYDKRQQLNKSLTAQGFVRAEVVDNTTPFQPPPAPLACMTLRVKDITLSIPQGTPVAYLAELIGGLS